MRSLPLIFGLLAGPAFADDVVIVASHDMLAAMTQAIVGPEIAVQAIAPSGANPATFSPDLDRIAQIQSADLIILNGAGFEEWASRVSLPRARTVDTTAAMQSDLIPIRGVSHSHGDGPAHSHGGVAPIVWLDFTLANRQAEAIAEGLTRQFPDAAGSHAQNLGHLQQRLTELDRQARALGQALGNRTVLVAHPGYEYLDRAYGIALREATFDDTAPATPAQLQALDALLDVDTARVMLWNAAPPAATADALASRDIAVVVLPNGTHTAEDQDPLDLIADGLTALADAID